MDIELDRSEAHRNVQRRAVERYRAAEEHVRALESARARAVLELRRVGAQLREAQLDRRRAELVWELMRLARQGALVDALRRRLRRIIRDVADPLQILSEIDRALRESTNLR
jgi:hypothetical protein